MIMEDQQLGTQILIPVLSGGDFTQLTFDPLTGAVHHGIHPGGRL